jgi:TolB-like protein
MSSIIPGYDYDIFISYRQKDNKHDGWVTEFVDNLKGELESTFKEEISVYFDINPHDGLLETHDVDASLKEKLKCLVFIPIISRTYCDPKSFAWEHEFKAFVEQASHDQFGLKVKLPNGNIANRVLPVRIHDLDISDIKLCESILGGVFRGVEFIYKSSGVNRPLRSKEDSPGDNLNKTFYRDQINKVALAIKEIILGLQTEPGVPVRDSNQRSELFGEVDKGKRLAQKEKLPKLNKRKWLSGVVILVVIIIAVIFAYPKIFKRDKLENLRSRDGKYSIAVMPFENLTGDTTLNWFQRGISSLIINGLGNSSELSVRDDHTMFEVMESMNQVFTAGISPSMAKKVAEKVRAPTYISGNYQGKEDKYWILVNLVNTESGDIIWTNKVEGDLKSSEYLNLADSLCNEIKNYLEIKALEGNVNYDFREAYPKSAEAYRCFIEGMNKILTQDYESAIQSLKKALEIDSTLTFASFYIAWAYNYSYQDEQAKIWTLKAYSGKDKLPIRYQLWLELWRTCYYDKNLLNMIHYCELLEKTDIKSRFLWFDLGATYSGIPMEYKKADKAVKAFEKAMEISLDWGGYWKYLDFYPWFGRAYHMVGKHKEEKEIYKIGLSIFPDNQDIISSQAICALSQGNIKEANEYIAVYKKCIKESGYTESILEFYLGKIYQEANLVNKAIEHFRNAHNLEPQNLSYIRYLAWLLIDNDINVSQGMEFVYDALEQKPENNQLVAHLLHAQGWGYYKQGKYQEALQALETAKEKFYFYDYETYQNIQVVKQAIANQKNN